MAEPHPSSDVLQPEPESAPTSATTEDRQAYTGSQTSEAGSESDEPVVESESDDEQALVDPDLDRAEIGSTAWAASSYGVYGELTATGTMILGGGVYRLEPDGSGALRVIDNSEGKNERIRIIGKPGAKGRAVRGESRSWGRGVRGAVAFGRNVVLWYECDQDLECWDYRTSDCLWSIDLKAGITHMLRCVDTQTALSDEAERTTLASPTKYNLRQATGGNRAQKSVQAQGSVLVVGTESGTIRRIGLNGALIGSVTELPAGEQINAITARPAPPIRYTAKASPMIIVRYIVLA